MFSEVYLGLLDLVDLYVSSSPVVGVALSDSIPVLVVVSEGMVSLVEGFNIVVSVAPEVSEISEVSGCSEVAVESVLFDFPVVNIV